MKNIKYTQRIITVLVVLVFIILMSNASLFALTSQTSDVKATVIVTEISEKPNKSIWSDKPQLENKTGQTYYGRVVVELWDHDGNISYDSDSDGRATPLLEQAKIGLEKIDEASYVDSPWTNEPVMGDYEGQIFHGRVTIELWNNQIVVAVDGVKEASLLTERAKEQIERVITNH